MLQFCCMPPRPHVLRVDPVMPLRTRHPIPRPRQKTASHSAPLDARDREYRPRRRSVGHGADLPPPGLQSPAADRLPKHDHSSWPARHPIVLRIRHGRNFLAFNTYTSHLSGICDRLGEESRIIAAAIHRDEGVLHLHVLAVPIVDGRICWADLRVRFGEGVMGPTRYGRMQTKFYYEISRGFGLERGKVGSAAVHKRPDRKKGRALCELRRRQMHAIRQRLREAGESPGGIPELQDPEPWERVVMAQKAQPGDPERVAKWFRTVGLKVRPFEELCQTVELENIRPLPRAPQLMMLIRARVAARRRVLAQLKIAEEELEKFERIKTDDPVEGHNEVLLAEIGAWLQRVEAYREALQTGNYNAVETFTDDEPVPGFSTWATRELEEGLKAEDDAAERGYDLGGDADLDAEASDDPSSGKRQEQKPE